MNKIGESQKLLVMSYKGLIIWGDPQVIKDFGMNVTKIC